MCLHFENEEFEELVLKKYVVSRATRNWNLTWPAFFLGLCRIAPSSRRAPHDTQNEFILKTMYPLRPGKEEPEEGLVRTKSDSLYYFHVPKKPPVHS